MWGRYAYRGISMFQVLIGILTIMILPILILQISMFQVLIGILTIKGRCICTWRGRFVSSPYRYSNNPFLWAVHTEGIRFQVLIGILTIDSDLRLLIPIPLVSSPYRYSNNLAITWTHRFLSRVSSPYRYSNNFEVLGNVTVKRVCFKSL